MKPLAKAIIDGVNAARGEPVVIVWGGALQKAAWQHYDHLAMSPEVRIQHDGVSYVAQAYYGGVFYCVQNVWDKVFYLTWYGRGGIVQPCLSYIITE